MPSCCDRVALRPLLWGSANPASGASACFVPRQTSRIGPAGQGAHLTKPEYFADAYALFLNDPGVFAEISPELLAWFQEGRYRDWPQ